MQTEIIFQRNSKGKGNLYYERSGHGTLRFINGSYKTSNRDEINDLLNSDMMKRNLIRCVTPMDIVDKWLRNETPDTLNKEMLSKVSIEGLKELAKVADLNERRHANQPAVLMSMLNGLQVSNAVSHIINKYKVEDEESEVKDWLQLAEEGGLVYRSGPWYKYRKGDEQDKTDDLTLGKTEVEAQQWCIDNQKEIDERLTNEN